MNNENQNYKIVSKWNKPGSRWTKAGDNYVRERTGKTNMHMVIMTVDGKSVTRHIEI